MNDNDSIFREEALNYRDNAWLGNFSISLPSILPIALCIAFGVIILAIIILTTCYSQRLPVTGQVLYSPAAAEAIFEKAGVITKISIHQGKEVKKGDLIAILNHDTVYSEGRMNQSLINDSEIQIEAFKKQEENKLQKGTQERANLRDRINVKEREILAIKKAIKTEEKRSNMLESRYCLYKKLRIQGIAVESEKIERENDYYHSLSQANMLAVNLERALGDKLELICEIDRSKAKEKEETAVIYQKIVSIHQQIITSSAIAESRVVAPIDGRITSFKIFEGKRVSVGETAAIIVPDDATPFIEMSLSPAALPYVAVGQTVMLRVSSLPWEWFGKVPGKIISIDESPDSLSSDAPHFRVVVVPDVVNPAIPAGVKVEADILSSRRPLWKWLFSPIKLDMKPMRSEG